MPCPFLEQKTYTTRKGKMTKHYCIARGLLDVLDRKTWKNICMKEASCIIRKQTEEMLQAKP